MNMSVSSSYSKEYVAPFTASYAQRISKIHEQREIKDRTKEDDVIHNRSAIGSTFRVSGPDNSRVYSAGRTFGLVRPLSVGRQRDESAGRSGSSSFRSSSTERLRASNNDTQLSYSSVQRVMTSFDRELQAQKDIAAIEKQKLALLQVKKESYINYLKNKGNTPWIPGGDGAKHESSLHKSVYKDAIEQRQLKQAWCRSPWPSAVPHKPSTHTTRTNSSNRPYAIPNQSSPQRVTRDVSGSEYYAFSPERIADLAKPSRSFASPQRLPGRVADTSASNPRNRADSDISMFSSSAPGSIASGHRIRAAGGLAASAASNAASAAPAGSNSKYVALTVRLINTAHPAQKSSYGVFIVPRNCSRLEMIAHIERQFSVHNQVSDISITYRSGYSHSVTVKSLSMGTIADIPDVNDYSSITIFLGGSTVFDSAGNIVTKSATGEVLSSKPADHHGVPHQQQQQLSALNQLERGGGLQQYTTAAAAGLDLGDTLQYFDAAEANSDDGEDEVASLISDTSSLLQTRAAASAPASVAPAASASAPPPPVQVPLYETLHPDQRHHSFSYASPAKPLLGHRGAGSVLASPKGSYYAPSPTASASARPEPQPQPSSPRHYEIQSYLLDTDTISAQDNTTLLAASRGGSSSNTAAANVGAERDRTGISTHSSFRDSVGSFHARDVAKSASTGKYMFPDGSYLNHREEQNQGGNAADAMEVPQDARRSNTYQVPQSQQSDRHAYPRDWLAEAEAQVQLEQRRKEFLQPPAALARHHSSNSAESVEAGGESFGSPAYRANTISSQIRRRAVAAPPVPATRGRSRSRTRSELDQQDRAGSVGRSRSGSTGAASRARSHSLDAMSRHNNNNNNNNHWSRPRRPALSPAGPPVIRTTAASRGRNAFINSRATDYAEGNHSIDTSRESSSRGRARSNSAGTTRSLNDARRSVHSFSHNDLNAPMYDPNEEEEGEEVWLSDPVARFGRDRRHRDVSVEYDQREDQWDGTEPRYDLNPGERQHQQQQRMQEQYQGLYQDYQDYPARLALNEGPQPGGAGDSAVSDAEDLVLPSWSHRQQHQQHKQQLQYEQQPFYPQEEGSHPYSQFQQQQQYQSADNDRAVAANEDNQPLITVTRRVSGRSNGSGKHFAMNLDDLLAEMA